MCQIKQSVFACSHFSPTRLGECQQLLIRRTHPEMNELTKWIWREPHSYEQVYDYIDNRICDDCVRQTAQDQVSTGTSAGVVSTRWRKQGWSAQEEVVALEGFLGEEVDRRARERRDERRRLRRMDMMELVEKEREKQKYPDFADILIPKEMTGIIEDVDWDIQPRPKEAKIDTEVAKLLDGEWIDIKELRARVTQQASVDRERDCMRIRKVDGGGTTLSRAYESLRASVGAYKNTNANGVRRPKDQEMVLE